MPAPDPAGPDAPDAPAPRPWHVAYVLHSLGRGGTENGVVNLVNRMDRERFRFTLVLLTPDRALLERVDRPLVETVTVGRRAGRDPFLALRLARLLRRLAPDLVHTRGFSALDGVLAARLAGVPWVVHSEHGRDLEEAHGMRARRALARRVLYRLADAVVTVSEELGDWIAAQARVPRSRLLEIPNGVDVRRFRALPERGAARARLGLPAQGRVVGTVGRQDPVKDHGALLRAFARLHAAHPDVWLAMVGDGPRHAALRSAARDLLVDDRVAFAGHRDDVAEVLPAFDVFALPSVTEGMSNALLEAMAAGLPCVATAVGGNPELVEHRRSGLLVPAGDVPALAAALGQVLGRPHLARKLALAGRRRVEERFTLAAMVARYEGLYASLLEKGVGVASPPGSRTAPQGRGAGRPAAALPQDVAARTLAPG